MEWREHDVRAVAQVNAAGTVQTFEREYFRKDSSHVPVLIIAATFEGGGNEGVAFVLDLSEQKRTAEILRNTQAELAHSAADNDGANLLPPSPMRSTSR